MLNIVVFSVVVLAAGCSSKQKGSSGEVGAAGSGASAGTGGTQGGVGPAPSDASTLVPEMVCGGERRNCPARPPAADSTCANDGLCCVYQAQPGTLRGCICSSGRWVCRDQACSCRGGR
jgi:hypothetical protein